MEPEDTPLVQALPTRAIAAMMAANTRVRSDPATTRRARPPLRAGRNPVQAGRLDLVKLEHRHESLLRDFDRTHPLHSSLAFLLLLQQLALAGDVTPVALGEHILSHCRDRLARDYLAADRSLERNHEHLSWNDRLQLLHELPALRLRLAAMHDKRERVDGFGSNQHVQLDEVALAEADHLVVHRRISFRTRLELVVKVVDDLAERHLVLEDDAITWPVLQVLVDAAALLAQFHHRPDVVGRNDDGQLHKRLRDRLDCGRVGHQGRIVDLDDPAALELHPVLDGQRRRDEVELELALQALLDDLEVQKPEEPAAEAKAERSRVLGLEGQRAVVELELLERFFEVAKPVGVRREESRKNHRLDLSVAQHAGWP